MDAQVPSAFFRLPLSGSLRENLWQKLSLCFEEQMSRQLYTESMSFRFCKLSDFQALPLGAPCTFSKKTQRHKPWPVPTFLLVCLPVCSNVLEMWWRYHWSHRCGWRCSRRVDPAVHRERRRATRSFPSVLTRTLGLRSVLAANPSLQSAEAKQHKIVAFLSQSSVCCCAPPASLTLILKIHMDFYVDCVPCCFQYQKTSSVLLFCTFKPLEFMLCDSHSWILWKQFLFCMP